MREFEILDKSKRDKTEDKGQQRIGQSKRDKEKEKKKAKKTAMKEAKRKAKEMGDGGDDDDHPAGLLPRLGRPWGGSHFEKA